MTTSTPSAAAIEKWKRVALAALSLWAIASVIYQGVLYNQAWFADPHVEQTARAFAAEDVDDAVFLKDIGHHRSILGPLFWWHNGWHGTAIPYYWRPLTMFGFWTEYHLFGAYRFDRWQIADICFYVLFAAVLWMLAYRVSGSRFVGPFAVVVLTGFALFDVPLLDFANYFTTPEGSVVLANWKDQPESWGAICTMASLLSVLGFPKRPERLSNRAWWSALAFAVASVCVKESGWLTFPMLLLALLYDRRLREVPPPVWIGTALSWVALIALRASAGRNVLFPPRDHNQHGLTRYFKHVVDPNVQQLTTDMWPTIAFAVVLGIVILSRRPRFLPKFAIVLSAAVAASFFLGLVNRTGIADGMALLVDPASGLINLRVALFDTLILLLAFREPPVRRQALFLYGLILLSDLPEILVLQPNAHMLFFTNGLQSVLTATIALACARQVVAIISARRRSRHASAVTI